MKNFFFLTGAGFLIWMLFFDANDFFYQWQTRSKLKDLEKEKEYYLNKIEEVKKDTTELGSDTNLLEKFAREKYLMKKDDEDLYILEKMK